MNARESSPAAGTVDRSSQLRFVLEDCMRRRTSGELLPDDEIIARNSQLMPELRQELRKLALIQRAVERGRSTSSALDVAAGQAGTDGAAPLDTHALPGYEIKGEIHRGGQGVVYRAIQQATERDVAIKVMREGPFSGPADKARFDREVHILGQLNHPNIVTIHDRGEAAGHFYYTMDYISGQPLDAYMAAGEHSVAESLRLFAKICDAVNAAHLRGVIHRDLKPSNIRIDESGEPYVLDFGLAKVAMIDSEAAPMTMTGQFVGSMPWASPEQAEGSPSLIDLRTDVYSLGVILYQMLTGKFPYVVVGNMRDVLDQIVKAEPVRPSTHRREINDEVETIVLKCLSKERERRYQSAGELARDVLCYLSGEPIEAKRDSSWYVLRKTVRRYRGPVAVAVAVLVLLAGGLVATSALYARALAAEAQATRRFDDVRKLANTFMFEFHEQIKDLAGSTPAREFLVATALEYLDELASEAGDDASLKLELAEAYRKVGDVQGNPDAGGHLGDTTGAMASYRKAMEMLAPLAAADPDNADIRRELSIGHKNIGDMLAAMGQSEEALACYRQSLEIAEALAAESPSDKVARRDLSVCYNRMGRILARTGQTEEALDWYYKTLEIAEWLAADAPLNAPARKDVAVCHARIGGILAVSGRTDEALVSFREALEIDEVLVAADPTDARMRRGLLVDYNKVGEMLATIGQTEEALVKYRTSLAIAEELAAADPDNAEAQRDVSIGHNKVGDTLLAMGHTDEALASFRAGLEIAEALAAADPTNAPAQRDLTISYNKVGGILNSRGQPTEALANYRKALAIRESLSAADPADRRARRDLSVSYYLVGNVAAAAEQHDEALANYRMFLEITESLSAADPSNVVPRRYLSVGHQKVGNVLAATGQNEEALESYRRALEIAEALSAADPSNASTRRDCLQNHIKVGKMLAALGRTAEALPSYERALELAESDSAADPTNATARRSLAVSYYNLGQAHAAAGADAELPAGERLEHWRAARGRYEQGRYVFVEMRERGILSASDAGLPEELAAELAACDEAIAELAGDAD